MFRNRVLLLLSTALLAGFVFFVLFSSHRASATAANAPRVPVVVELFTSEGCSSCPPADQVLSQLVRNQPVEGVEVIGLGYHVDYWDQLGWHDRFSSPQFTARQQAYDAQLRDDTYTPQMVIDGRRTLVGSDPREVGKNLAAAAKRAKMASVQLQGGAGKAQVSVSGAGKGAQVYLALAENGLETKVGGGENGGRTLHHDAVVRGLYDLGKLNSDSWTGSWQAPENACSAPANSRLVALLQRGRAGEVLAVAALPLSNVCAR